ncbi:LPP leucine zipper domain-containing protein [Candidatus Riesia pediculicola]|uniref:LPP leucine zipper domain-containing protein n=1 Tax=Candidatus Riesia pediculicola TaxID=401619 RepID=UPI0009E259A5|nr:LPP leucine zipper domain-containing protein [Candidatus Riesia pediculicola]
MKNKFILFFLTLIFLTLSGCTTNNQTKKISSDLNSLKDKVENISEETQSIQADLQNTKEEAVRANQRLDNQVHKYKK